MSGTGAASAWMGVVPAVVTQGVPLPVLGTLLRVDGIGRFSKTGRIYIVASSDVGDGLRPGDLEVRGLLLRAGRAWRLDRHPGRPCGGLGLKAEESLRDFLQAAACCGRLCEFFAF